MVLEMTVLNTNCKVKNVTNPKKWIEIKTENKIMQVYRVFKMDTKIWKRGNVLRPTGKLPSFSRRRWGASKRSLLELSWGIAPVSDPEVPLGVWWGEGFLDGCAMLHVRSNCWFLVCVSDRPMEPQVKVYLRVSCNIADFNADWCISQFFSVLGFG